MSGIPDRTTKFAVPPAGGSPDRERKPAFRRGMSRKKSARAGDSGPAEEPVSRRLSRGLSRGLSRKRSSLCKKLAGSKDEPQFGSRAKTGGATLSAKKQVLERYPGLGMQTAAAGELAEELVFHGVNSIRAEVIDMNGMIVIMRRHMKMLSHTAVERFFEWMPIFAVYVERYMMVEEDFLLKWVERKADTLKGALRPSARMVLRGKIQKEIKDVQNAQHDFHRHLPAGERLGKLEEVVERLTHTVVEYAEVTCGKLPAVLRAHFSKGEVDKARTKIIKHVVGHVGYQDFLTLYTRWMRPGELLEWKTGVLFPCDFKFFSYKTWEKDMDVAHYQIAAQFAEMVEEEEREAAELNKQSKADFARAQATRREMEPLGGFDGVEVEMAEEVECVGEEVECVGEDD